MLLLIIGLTVLLHQIYCKIVQFRKTELGFDPKHSKILLIGQAGAGKSTLGQELARTHDLFYIDFDKLIYGENWVRRSYDEVKDLTEELINKVPDFIIEGSFNDSNDRENVRGQVLSNLICRLAVNKVVWLDLWTSVRICRIIKRSIGRYLGLVKAGASREKWANVKAMLCKQWHMSEYSRSITELEWRNWVNSGLCSSSQTIHTGLSTTIRCLNLDNPF